MGSPSSGEFGDHVRHEARLKVEVFSSLEDENESEYSRRALMTPDECMEELAVLQERMWGRGWGLRPIEKVVSWERLEWWRE